jgi:hypothetical protein
MTLPHRAGVEPANENWPIVRLRPIGDGAVLAKTIVRVLVRRALVAEGIVPGREHCGTTTRTG